LKATDPPLATWTGQSSSLAFKTDIRSSGKVYLRDFHTELAGIWIVALNPLEKDCS
jgi:hypothetical protein